ncbi:MAG: hypothetical protein PHY48_11955 [Candidatus Cloacimonetes bacterium]|nr:hypothetical protein [Candidatus Cloacimonadota bacterium]
MVNRIVVVLSIALIVITSIVVFKSLTAPVYITDGSTEISYLLEPIQIDNPDTLIPLIEISGSKFTLTAKAAYHTAGLVVSTKHYIRGFMSKLSPYDYALIWGKAPEYLPYLKFDQMVRFCLFTTKHPDKIDLEYFSSHMSNNHLIPATPNLRKAMGLAKKKDIVEIDGFLVYVIGQDKKNNSSSWNSSLTREDKGNGACEIIYVTRLKINDRVYE